MKSLKLPLRQYLIIPVLTALVVGGIAFYAMSSLAAEPDIARADSCDTQTCVALKKDGATPNTITVPVGSFVSFNAADGASHNLSLGKGGDEHEHSGPFHSGEFKPNEAWKVQFKEPGTFFFHDHLNPDTNILVVVYQPNGDHSIR